ncbi:hypothetical protein LKO27_14900 [Tessaracoccus sp. OS52]|uniref:hypothetical protein n=1 Tax=Tessaracoccus sp. OS52 TaxID=2886691 RepID=UPI001D103FC8|nr:hypothetical protein [Tessaracoccus sp. OS52]MCC2594689.1 hypothetical protein [Tessaracoccus sp. OS52]
MIILLAHGPDPWAPELARQVEGLSGEPTRVLTPRDLSRRGWALPSPPDGTGRLVVDGEPVAEADVGLVVALLEDVLPEELVWIREEDADYVAAEMTAFLRYWLAGLPERVLVAPGACSLAGPDHPVGAWADAAGLAAAAPGRRDWRQCREVSVADGVATGDASPRLRAAATAMARWAGLPWLRAFFAPDTEELWSVSPLPALAHSTGAAAGVIAAALDGRRAA